MHKVAVSKLLGILVNCKHKMRKLVVCTALLFATLTAQAQKAAPPQSSPISEIPTVAYCDLIHNPENYDGKIIRINATYRSGFEWAELYCLNCWDMAHRTWVDFEGELCRKSKKINHNGTMNVQVVGKFFGIGRMGYGHMNAYRYKFIVHCIEEYKLIWKNSNVPSALPDDVAKKAKCETKSSQH